MALTIICDQVSEDKNTGKFTCYFYVVDDASPDVRLRETTVEGSTQAEVEAQLLIKFKAYKKVYERQQLLLNLGNAVAQNVVIATQEWDLSATSIITGTPSCTSPAISLDHNLITTSFSTNNVDISMPTLGEI